MNARQDRSEFINLIVAQIEHVTSDKAHADEYLREAGLDPDAMAAEGIKQIRKRMLLASKARTLGAMDAVEHAKQRAIEYVDRLLQTVDFSFDTFLQNERPRMSFRGIESLDPSQMRDIMIQHFTLKFSDSSDADDLSSPSQSNTR
ncbi:MAG: hypothetical protein JSS75_01960 [Bacteroidetes bacterium]|nr:hypothetical protein [Bacteroidota bacterium]